jgi:hypothetical protein
VKAPNPAFCARTRLFALFLGGCRIPPAAEFRQRPTDRPLAPLDPLRSLSLRVRRNRRISPSFLKKNKKNKKFALFELSPEKKM